MYLCLICFRFLWWLVFKGCEDKVFKVLYCFGSCGDEGVKCLVVIKKILEEVKREIEGVIYFECF